MKCAANIAKKGEDLVEMYTLTPQITQFVLCSVSMNGFRMEWKGFVAHHDVKSLQYNRGAKLDTYQCSVNDSWSMFRRNWDIPAPPYKCICSWSAKH